MGLDNPIHLVVVLVVMLLVFGAKRLPEMGRSLGDGLRGFKDAVSDQTVHSQSATETLTPAPDADATPLAAVKSDTLDA